MSYTLKLKLLYWKYNSALLYRIIFTWYWYDSDSHMNSGDRTPRIELTILICIQAHMNVYIIEYLCLGSFQRTHSMYVYVYTNLLSCTELYVSMQIQCERIFYIWRTLGRKSGHAKRKLGCGKDWWEEVVKAERRKNGEKERDEKKRWGKEKNEKSSALTVESALRVARRIKNLSKKYSHCKSSHLQSTPSAFNFLFLRDKKRGTVK